MTAEVAILNKSAIALAADSKATVGFGEKKKTHDTVNKLFTLSKFHPIGIMVYGNAEFMRIPWETLVKIYRDEKGKDTHATVKEWAENFVKWLHSCHSFTRADYDYNVMSIVIEQIAALTIDKGLPEFEKALDDKIEKFEKKKELPYLTTAQRKKLIPTYRRTLKTTFETVFDSKFLTAKTRRKLFRLALLALTKNEFSRGRSGIVIAGFGESEKFPAMIDYYCDGIILGKIKLFERRYYQAGHDRKSAYVRPFAQTDMVHRFMNGIDPEYADKMDIWYLTGVLQSIGEVVDTHFQGTPAEKDAIKAQMHTKVGDYFKKFRSDQEKFRKDNYSDPILDVVSQLPKEELANLAEALVNLTSIKRRVSHDEESVGGAIDVAVISKGDGFIWIKRKHYFDPKFNQSFMLRYLQQ